MQKKKPARKRYDIPKTASCHVCGDLAAEHLHYGGIACYSCRAFFRRTVNSNRPILECSNDQNCKINKDTRKRCQFCRFEKCKAVGMKTGWVLTEDDKSKLAMRRTTSSPGGGPLDGGHFLNIKKEDPHEIGQPPSAPSSEEGLTVKQRHASSPMSPPANESSPHSMSPPYKAPLFFPGMPNHHQPQNPFFPNNARPFLPNFGIQEGYQASQSQPFYRPPYNHHPQQAEYNPFQNFFMRTNNEDPTQQSSLFPLNINKMQVSLSGASDGVSLTIETNQQGFRKSQEMISPRNSDETYQNKFHQDFRNNAPRNQAGSQNAETAGTKDAVNHHFNTMSPGARSPTSWSPGLSEQNAKRQKKHHQQSRTIFRCVSGENAERDCDSRSTIASQVSDTSGSQVQHDVNSNHNQNDINVLDEAFSLYQSRSNEDLSQAQQGVPPDQVKPQVWKLTEQSIMDPSPLLQETILIFQDDYR